MPSYSISGFCMLLAHSFLQGTFLRRLRKTTQTGFPANVFLGPSQPLRGGGWSRGIRAREGGGCLNMFDPHSFCFSAPYLAYARRNFSQLKLAFVNKGSKNGGSFPPTQKGPFEKPSLSSVDSTFLCKPFLILSRHFWLPFKPRPFANGRLKKG